MSCCLGTTGFRKFIIEKALQGGKGLAVLIGSQSSYLGPLPPRPPAPPLCKDLSLL
jgi:hypothetical protein